MVPLKFPRSSDGQPTIQFVSVKNPYQICSTCSQCVIPHARCITEVTSEFLASFDTSVVMVRLPIDKDMGKSTSTIAMLMVPGAIAANAKRDKETAKAMLNEKLAVRVHRYFILSKMPDVRTDTRSVVPGTRWPVREDWNDHSVLIV